MNDAIAYQVISRNNDKNGNPFRLILIYDARFKVINVVEAHSSMPNYIDRHCRHLIVMPTFHLEPKEYNSLVKFYNTLGLLTKDT